MCGECPALWQNYLVKHLCDLPEEEEEVPEDSSVERIKNLLNQKEAPHALQRLSKMNNIPRNAKDILTKGLN